MKSLTNGSLEIIKILPCENGRTAEEILRKRGFSRRLIVRLKRVENGITRNGCLCRTIDRVFAGEELLVRSDTEKDGSVKVSPSISTVNIAYEDEHIIIYDKPPFMPVHQSRGHYTDTLANVFAAKYPDRPFRAVNRLDRNTSGLCLCAKTRRGANIPTEKIDKVYYAVCEGELLSPLTVDAPIEREQDSLIKRIVSENGKRAVTDIVPISCRNGLTLLRITLQTGRTHQIRVHLSHIGYPLAGDELYGGHTDRISRQALHCGKMTLIHPVTGERKNVSSPLPEDMKGLVQ